MYITGCVLGFETFFEQSTARLRLLSVGDIGEAQMMVREVLQTIGSDEVRYFADKMESFSSHEGGDHLRTGQGDRGSVTASQDDDRAPVDEAKPKPVKRLQPESSRLKGPRRYLTINQALPSSEARDTVAKKSQLLLQSLGSPAVHEEDYSQAAGGSPSCESRAL